MPTMLSTRNLLIYRILFTAFILVSALFWPFWISLILLIAGMGIFNIYIEGVVIFLLIDLLYGAEVAKFGNFTFMMFSISVLMLILVEFLKKKIRIE